MELPPRARRILGSWGQSTIAHGTTSACAENTIGMLTWQDSVRNYLRVRGEYGITVTVAHTTRELPPRARRIHVRDRPPHTNHGTTSACAENTKDFLAGWGKA